MSNDDLLDGLRRECPSYREWLFGNGKLVSVEVIPDELATLIRKRERAAAERMRERCDLDADLAKEEARWNYRAYDGRASVRVMPYGPHGERVSARPLLVLRAKGGQRR